MPPRSSLSARASSAIGAGVEVKGRIEGDEDLHVDGRVEGTVSISGALTISPDAMLAADVSARSVEIAGSVLGDVRAAEQVVLHASARLVGNIFAPRLTVAEGAAFKGQIDMSGGAAPAKAKSSASGASRAVPSARSSGNGGVGRRDDREITVVVKHAELSRGERPAEIEAGGSSRRPAPKKRAKKTVRARVPARGKSRAKTARRDE